MANGEPSVWTVDNTREEYQWDDGQYVKGVRVSFRTGNGQHGSVWVSDADFSPSRVRDAIAPRAAALDEVAGMTGG